MTIILAIIAGILLGGGCCFLALKSRLEQLGEIEAKWLKLTDRDPKTGRFVK